MTREVSFLSSNATVRDSLDMFETSVARHIPVLNEAGKIEGILSDRDKRTIELTLALFQHEKTRNQIYESSVMSIVKKEGISVFPETSLVEAAQMIIDLKIGAVPVIEKSKLVGILSYYDIINIFAEMR